MRCSLPRSFVLVFALALLVLPSGLSAHNTKCKHSHDNLLVVTCNPNKADCRANGMDGVCMTRRKRKGIIYYKDCFCIVETGDYLSVAGSSGCQLDGWPLEGAVLSCSFLPTPQSVVGIWDSSCQQDYAGLDGESFTGALQLAFGSFADPTRVPVEVVGGFLTLPPFDQRGMDTGLNVYEPNPTVPNSLFYDATTGRLDTESLEPLALLLTNNLSMGEPTVLYLGGEIDPVTQLYTANFQMQYAIAPIGQPICPE